MSVCGWGEGKEKRSKREQWLFVRGRYTAREGTSSGEGAEMEDQMSIKLLSKRS
jgi:hypothetical protein